jgi:phosphohistidine swiveling domain-containing protein
VLELALQMPPTLGYVGLTLAIPVFLTALISVACGLLFVLAAAVGISLDSRATTTLTIAPLVALFVWAVQAALGALRRRLPSGPVVTLAQVAERALPVTQVGAKAHTLAQLRGRGAHVAPGWVLRAEVFARVGDVSSEAAALAVSVSPSALRRLHRELEASGEPRFLLRSSFSGEDGARHAAPGVYESVVWARTSGRTGLATAIRTVWASYWGARAVAYRSDQALASGPPRLAILAQPVLRHERSGVAASVDLVNGGRDAHLIDAGDWQGRHALLSDRVDALSAAADAHPLAHDIVRQASKLAGMAELLLGAPAEIEWGADGQQVTLYQARLLSGAPTPITVTHRHIVELPRYPLTPLSHSFLWGDEAPARVLSEGMTPLGLTALSEDALVRVKGRVMLNVSAFKALALGLSTASGLRGRVVLSALLGRTGQGHATPPVKPPLELEDAQASSLVARLHALRMDHLRPRLAQQMRALAVAASLEAWLEAASGPEGAPRPRLARPDAGDAWYRAERAAELSCPRRGEAEMADGSVGAPPPPPDGSPRGGLLLAWVSWARDRQLTEREALNAQIQCINFEARQHAVALDARLASTHPGWVEGDVFYCTLPELEAHVVSGQALPSRAPRRLTYTEDNAAHVPGVCDLDASGAPVARREVKVEHGESVVVGIAVGRGVVTGRLCVLREGDVTSVDAARGRVVLVHGGAPIWSAHVMVAQAVALVGAGPLSHLALLARERGVPVLAAVSGAVDDLESDAEVTLDLETSCLRREG